MEQEAVSKKKGQWIKIVLLIVGLMLLWGAAQTTSPMGIIAGVSVGGLLVVSIGYDLWKNR